MSGRFSSLPVVSILTGIVFVPMKYLLPLTFWGLLTLASASVYSNDPDGISLDIALGENDTQLKFDQSATGYTLIGSNQSDCNFDGPDLCDGMWSQTLTETPVVDEATTLDNPGYFQITDDSGAVNFSIAKREVPESEGFVVVEFLNKLWFLGGRYPNRDETSTTIWSSTDGWSWTEEYVEDTLFPRTSFNAVVFKGQLWVLGGLDVNYLSARDVWKSSDGVNWDLVTEDAGFVPGRIVVFKDRLWSIGGWERTSDSDGILKDIWSSADGIHWRRELSDVEFLNRSKFEVAVHQGRIWLTGGGTGRCPSSSDYSDTWYTEDGIVWHASTVSVTYPSRCGHRMLNHNGQLYIVGGASSNKYLNDVWVLDSENGWLQVTDDTGYMERLGSQVLSYQGQLWTFGGKDRASIRHSDIWSSGDGVEWKSDELLRFPLRYDHQSISFKDRLWVIGGQDFTEYWHNAIVTGSYDSVKSDIWSSVEGYNWSLEVEKPSFSDRFGHQVVEFGGSLWLIGGKEGRVKVLTAGAPLNDIWRSEDGVDWTLVTESADFPAVSGHQVAKFNDALWMTGGKPESSRFSGGIWNSRNGIDWNYLEANKDFSNRFNHKMVVFNNKLFVIGGYEINSETGSSSRSDIWSSEDGVNWILEREDGGFPATRSHEIVSFKNKLWMYGGVSGSIYEAIWSSDNGVDWTKERESTPFGEVFGARVTVHGNSLILTGGRGGYRENKYVWSSRDGIKWKRIYSTFLPPMRPRSIVSSNVNGGGYIYPNLDQVVDYSMPAEFVITAEEGNHLISVEGCGGSLVGDRFFIPSVTEDCVVEARFERITLDISTLVSAGGSISPVGPVNIDYGDTTTFDINVLDGFVISSVEGCDGVLVGNQYITGVLTTSCQVEVYFRPRKYSVDVVVGAGGDISGDHSLNVIHGDSVTFSIIPDNGYHLANISGCDGNLINDEFTTSVITSNCSIYITFTEIFYSIKALASDGGKLEPSGITSVKSGGDAAFNILPDIGFELANVTGCTGEISDNTYVISDVYSDCEVVANFQLKEYLIGVTASIGGTVIPEHIGGVKHGESTSFSISPDKGYQIDSVTGCDGYLEENTFIIPGVDAVCSVNVSFSLLQVEVSIDTKTGGQLDPAEPFSVSYGSDYSVLVVPDVGFQLESITGCSGVINDDRFLLSNLIESCSISAIFAPLEYEIPIEIFTAGEYSDTLVVSALHGAPTLIDVPTVDGYEFMSAQGCDGEVNGSSYMIDTVTGACAIRLDYSEKQYTVTIEVVGSETYLKEDALIVSHGNTVQLSVLPENGYYISGVSGCSSSLSGNTLSVGPVIKSCVVLVEFKPLSDPLGVEDDNSSGAPELESADEIDEDSSSSSGGGAITPLTMLNLLLIFLFARRHAFWRKAQGVL